PLGIRGGAMQQPSLTLGVEEEYQIIDPETRELRSYITEILAGDHLVMEEVKLELHQAMVESGTKVCRTPGTQDCRRRHAPVLQLDHAGDHAARAVHGRQTGPAGSRPTTAHLRHARPHRDRGSRLSHRRHERGALLRAARAVSVHQLAVLDGP